MKGIAIFESAKTRERRETQHQAFIEMHRCVTAPVELLRPVPRPLRWKTSAKTGLAISVIVAAMALIAGGYLMIRATMVAREFSEDIDRMNQRMRQRARQATDPDVRARAEKAIQEGEALDRKWRLAGALMIANVVFGCVLMPLVHVSVAWYGHIRPGLRLLRNGAPARATVTACRRWLGILLSVEFGFTAENGANIRRKQVLSRKESFVFTAGESVWVLYLPARPKLAHIYGLKSAPAVIQVP